MHIIWWIDLGQQDTINIYRPIVFIAQNVNEICIYLFSYKMVRRIQTREFVLKLPYI